MDLRTEVYKTTVDTWRYEVESYWQRNNYFAAFETAALAGCWYVIEHAHLWIGLAFSAFGFVSAGIWFITSVAVLHYVRYWWGAVKTAENKLGLNADGLDFSARHPGSGLRPSDLILCIPLIFAAAWVTELVFTFMRLHALDYPLAAAQQKGGFVSTYSFEGIFQGASLLVLAATVFVAYRQMKEATAQARASERQAKSSEQMAERSLQQSETMRAQLHATFRPVVEVTGGAYEREAIKLELTNVGTGPALALSCIYRSGHRESIGSLEAGKSTVFKFIRSANEVQPPVGPPEVRAQWKGPTQEMPLRLEYQSVTGAKCWTNVDFELGAEGAVVAQNESGWSIPTCPMPVVTEPF